MIDLPQLCVGNCSGGRCAEVFPNINEILRRDRRPNVRPIPSHAAVARPQSRHQCRAAERPRSQASEPLHQCLRARGVASQRAAIPAGRYSLDPQPAVAREPPPPLPMYSSYIEVYHTAGKAYLARSDVSVTRDQFAEVFGSSQSAAAGASEVRGTEARRATYPRT